MRANACACVRTLALQTAVFAGDCYNGHGTIHQVTQSGACAALQRHQSEKPKGVSVDLCVHHNRKGVWEESAVWVGERRRFGYGRCVVTADVT